MTGLPARTLTADDIEAAMLNVSAGTLRANASVILGLKPASVVACELVELADTLALAAEATDDQPPGPTLWLVR